MHNPSISDISAAKRILKYLAGTPSHGICIQPASKLSIKVYSNSDWARCHITRRSTTGFCVLLGGNIVSWSSKKQPTVSRSSTEVEYKALATTAAELAYNPVLHSRSEHIALDYHFVREKVALGDLIVKHVPTTHQLADAFTKSLSTTKFLAAIDNLCLSRPAQIEGECKSTSHMQTTKLSSLFVLETLGKLVIEEGKFLLGVKDQVGDLEKQLKSISWFVRDSVANRENNRALEWVIRERH
ncbi:hypothetical protein LIER_38789 [Lithospermum erythrorhizon]|uniref:Retrovirus-related Pol polyprotein from transposon RE1 n=1 Tax=Lithospermum erythrorhizon TaxID=34254 RepID=A0AAV3Q6R5_LITER